MKHSVIRLAAALVLAWLTAPAYVHARVDTLDEFARLSVLNNGRKMPLDTFARQQLLQFSGKSTWEGEPAIAWLAEVFFEPSVAVERRVFLINHPEVAEALGIAPEEHRRYSYRQLHRAGAQLARLASAANRLEKKDRSIVEDELVRVYGNVTSFSQLLSTFQFLLPLDDFAVASDHTRAYLGLPAKPAPLSFRDVFEHIPAAEEMLTGLQNRDPQTWTPEESNLYDLASRVFHWARTHRQLIPALVPVAGHGKVTWVSPWDALQFTPHSEALDREINLMEEMVTAYRAGQALDFSRAAEQLRQAIREQVGNDREMARHGLEIRYNRAQLFYRAELLYGLAFLLAFTALVSGGRKLRWLALALVVVGLLPHTAGIVARMVIMARPPVTNLYATFIFVAWIGVLLCLVMELAQKNTLGVLAASFLGLSLLLISGRFVTEGDSMGKVVAVLDSNFWLSTHVVCITIGYAGCVAAGVVGHLYILQSLLKSVTAAQLKKTYRALFAVLGFGLTFAFFGTMLGGVWADQSWGRFWGWDPKENGALLIVLWCAILFHARLGKLIGDLGVAAGSVLGVIVVMFAWLGVNLLGVGLHSYGFTSGVARGLYMFIAAELVFLAATLPAASARLRRREG